MRTPLNWISLYTDISDIIAKDSIKNIAHQYSIHTAEIDGIETHSIDRVVVGKVLSCTKHPDSTKLSICEVLIGDGEKTTILTGAPNIVDATYVPVALVGARLAPEFVISDRKMAGMMSSGMICGADEIGLATESDGGIMILENMWDTTLLESMIGQSLFDLTFDFPGRDGKKMQLPLGDTTFEIDNKFITNRPDLFGVYGNAREWGAVFGKEFREYTNTFLHADSETISIKIETNRCLAYNTIEMKDISVENSPFGMSLMMARAGLAPKMDLVDITNCILTEFGQPMHVFDADKLVGGITVRQARSGEKLLALNSETYELTPEDMVIADDNGPIALAGIIGGMDSAVSMDTTRVIWESATFDAVSVRLSAQRHGVRTDASTRYEKSLDPRLSLFALARILDYLNFLGKNIDVTATSSYLDEKQVKNITIDVEYDFIRMKAGVHIPKENIDTILTQLGFFLQKSDDTEMVIKVPSWRASKDVNIREDIAEEVIRIYGYENIPMKSLDSVFTISKPNSDKTLRDQTLGYWEGKGWNEAYNYSFSNEELDHAIGYMQMDDAIAIQNAFNESYTHMRRSLSVRLFENIKENLRHSTSLRFFEIGKVYHKTQTVSLSLMEDFLEHVTSRPFPEKKMFAGVATDMTIESLRRDIENYLDRVIGYVPPLHQDNGAELASLHPGASASYHVGDDVIVRFGRVHPSTAEYFELPTDTLYFEVEYEEILRLTNDRESLFAPISKYQKIDRELNFVMDELIHTGDIATTISALHPWIRDITVDSVYRDTVKIGEGKKSVSFAFVLQSNESTISDEEAMGIQNMVIEKMKTQDIEIRSI